MMSYDSIFPKPIYWVYFGGILGLIGAILTSTGEKGYIIISFIASAITIYAGFLHQIRSSKKQDSIKETVEELNFKINKLTTLNEHLTASHESLSNQYYALKHSNDKELLPLPEAIKINIELKLHRTPQDLRDHFPFPINHKSPSPPHYIPYQGDTFDYIGDPFYNNSGFYLRIEFFRKDDLLNSIFLAKTKIDIRRNAHDDNPSIRVGYMFEQHFTRISIKNLPLKTNNRGIKKYKNDLENCILRISMNNLADNGYPSPVYLNIIFFQIEDTNEYLSFVLNDFTTKQTGDSNVFETLMTAGILKL